MKTIRTVMFSLFALLALAQQAQAVLYWGRPYDPNLQRWIQRDPIGERGGVNLYNFVENSPVSRIDPQGLWWWDAGYIQYGVPQLTHDLFYGSDFKDPTPAADTQLALDANAGIGPTPLTDGQGNTAKPGDLVQDTVLAAAAQVAMLPVGGPEDEGAYAAAAKGLQAAEDAAKAARAAAKCEKAAQKLKNILGKNLKDGPKGDISGAIHDMVGNPIPKPDGGTWDHVQDLGNMLRGLQNGVDALANTTDPAQIAVRGQAQQAIQQIRSAITGAGL